MKPPLEAGRFSLAVLLVLAAAIGARSEPLADGLYAVIHTSRGVITAELFPDRAPLAVANFVGLAEGTIPFEGRPAGKPYFDGIIFHRVVPGFVIQGGDPLGTGQGGPGYSFADEFTPLAKHVRGALAMANTGPGTNGSQFYFAIEPVHRLNYKHTVFGVVHSGMEVVASIEQGDAIEHVAIVRAGGKAAVYRVTPESFARLRESTHVIAPRDPSLPRLFATAIDLGLPDWFPPWIEEKLHHYHQTRGTQIFVRLVCGMSDLPGEPREALRSLYASLAQGDASACLLVYLDDEKSWRLWLGDGIVPLFAAPPAGDGEASGLHVVKREILAPARAEIDAGRPRRSVDAAVTSLIETLDSKTSAM